MDESKGDGRLFVYRIDGDNRIVFVNPQWLEFAFENGGSTIVVDSVLQKPLWKFVSGDETRQLYELILYRVRGKCVSPSIPFRCDSPDLRRFMRMEISLRDEGIVEFSCRVVRTEARTFINFLDPAASRSAEFLRLCGWCKKVFLEGTGWVEVEEAVACLRLLDGEFMPQHTHGICEPCRDRLMSEINR